MKRTELHPLIVLGMQERFILHAAEEGADLADEKGLLTGISVFRAQLETLPLPVTLAATEELGSLEEKLRRQLKAGATHLTLGDSQNLTRLMERIEHTLLSEAKTKSAYVVRDGRFANDKLTGDCSGLFPERARGRVPLAVMMDIYDGGRAIAFELSTAAVFHAMRATEAALRTYFQSIVKKSAPKADTWWALVDHLKKRKSRPKPDERLLANLDILRTAYRNAAAHPGQHFELHEAELIFTNAIDVITRMVEDPRFKSSGQTWQEFLDEIPHGVLDAPSNGS